MAIASLLAAHRGGIRLDRSPLVALVLMATVSSLLGSHVLPHIKPELFETLIAIATILSLPLFFNRHGRFQVGERTERSRFIGYVVIGLLTVTGSVLFTSTFSLLTALALPFFFGTSTLESASIRRVMALVQMIVLATILHEHIVWNYTLATVTGGMLGSYIGTHIAVNKGEEFARSALLVLAVVSALALLF